MKSIKSLKSLTFRKLWKDDLWRRNYGLQRMVKVTKKYKFNFLNSLEPKRTSRTDWNNSVKALASNLLDLLD